MNVHALRAPAEDGAQLVYPSLTDLPRLLHINDRHRVAAANVGQARVLGRSLGVVRDLARSSTLEAARAYLREAGEPLPNPNGPLLFVAGHQPELFHPGVWLKNFALYGLARRGTALNLLVDNDTAKDAHLRLPAGQRVLSVPFDRWQSQAPFEERRVLDEGMFGDFLANARPAIDAWPFQPLLPDFWQEACRQAERTPLLGERFAAARRSIERRWGCHNLELPLSRLCDTEAFAWFACHLLVELPRLHEVYNGAVAAYRQRHGLRSSRHPVPDLARDGAWLESPLWCWRSGQGRRGRLFVRRDGQRLLLRCEREDWPALDAATSANVPAQWLELRAQGYKMRTRALTTTLFARLFLADLFIHGLGGGKYDEVTDDIMRGFYGVEPPHFLVVTGTLRLPFQRLPASEGDLRRARHLRRDSWWNPQRHEHAAAAEPLVNLKKEWIVRPTANEQERRERFDRLRGITGHMRELAGAQGRSWADKVARIETEVQINAVQGRRDFAFCLYPEEKLKSFCNSLGTSAS